jgi:hypothetical protein
MEEWIIDPCFLELGTGWTRVVSFTPLPLYRRGKSPGTHWIGGWVYPPQPVWRIQRSENLEPTRTRTLTSRSSSRQPVAIPTVLPKHKQEISLRNRIKILSSFLIDHEAQSFNLQRVNYIGYCDLVIN